METKSDVVGSKLAVSYKEIKTFALLLQLYLQDLINFYIRNYSPFLDEIFHKWLENFDIEPFYNMINNLGPDLKFIFGNPSKSLNFLDINLQIVQKKSSF